MAVIIINHGADNGEDHRVVGPFATGQAASDWAFRNLPLGMDWYWLPLEAPKPNMIRAH